MARQRQLERCKWVFWRVSESNFRFDCDKAMSSLWRKLEELGIQPVTEAPTASPSETAQRTDTPNPPKRPARSGSAPLAQLDLVSPPQLELDVARSQPLVASLGHTVAAQLKRSRPNGFFTRDEICRVVLAFLQADGRMGRKELMSKVIKALDLPEHHEKRVEEAFGALDHAGMISIPLGANVVSLIRA